MFTRFDVERNEQTLQQAVSNGKVPETTYNVSSVFTKEMICRYFYLGIK
jgi:hypothetical protein